MNTNIDQLQSAAADNIAGSPAHQAYRILHFGFTVAPIIAGLDKFFHLLVKWDQYLPGGETVTHTAAHADACRRRHRDCRWNWGRA